jgi:hypothetical protein
LKKAVILERKEGVIMRKMGRRNVCKEGGEIWVREEEGKIILCWKLRETGMKS